MTEEQIELVVTGVRMALNQAREHGGAGAGEINRTSSI